MVRPSMLPLLKKLHRFVLFIANLLAMVTTASIVTIALLLFLAAHGYEPRVLRFVVQILGRPFLGQQTDHIETRVQIDPSTNVLSAVTTVTMRSLESNRPRFAFLFNPAFRLRKATLEAAPPNIEVTISRISWLMLVEPTVPVEKTEALSIRLEYDGVLPANPPDPNPSHLRADSIALGPESFWFPTDAQGFFTADVQVTLPRALTLLHNDIQATREEHGDLQTVHWRTRRPIGSIPILAGRFQTRERTRDGTTYRLYLAENVGLDSEKLLDEMADANEYLSTRLGPSGFDSLSLYVSRDLRRGVNYGTGLIGTSIRYFRSGDYGFGLLAHEIAHNWFGATVAERWLQPATGGQWLVEGMAELASLLATEERFGRDALTHRLASALFDPAKQQSIHEMSMIDNVLSEPVVRDTIYRKGSLVAYRLCSTLGLDTCFGGLRNFIEKYRYSQVGDGEIQAAFEQAAGHSLEEWFATWIRSDHLADLELATNGPDGFSVKSHGAASWTEPLNLWLFENGQEGPTETTIQVGQSLTVRPDQVAILDPLVQTPDVERANNRVPQGTGPIFVTAGKDETLATVTGEPTAWGDHQVSLRQGSAVKHTWQLERGLLFPPVWSADGRELILNYSDAENPVPEILSLTGDGTRRFIGRGYSPAPVADGTILAARKDSILRLTNDGHESVVLQRPGYVLDLPSPAPEDPQFAYIAARRNQIELRVAANDGTSDRVLITWDRDRTWLRWAPSGKSLFVMLGGDADWQIWEVDVASGSTRILMRDASAVGDLAVSPDGTYLAVTAAPESDYPANRKQLFILPVSTGNPQRMDIPGVDLGNLTWTSDQSIVAIATEVPAKNWWHLPESRRLKEIRLPDLEVRDLP